MRAIVLVMLSFVLYGPKQAAAEISVFPQRMLGDWTIFTGAHDSEWPNLCEARRPFGNGGLFVHRLYFGETEQWSAHDTTWRLPSGSDERVTFTVGDRRAVSLQNGFGDVDQGAYFSASFQPGEGIGHDVAAARGFTVDLAGKATVRIDLPDFADVHRQLRACRAHQLKWICAQYGPPYFDASLGFRGLAFEHEHTEIAVSRCRRALEAEENAGDLDIMFNGARGLHRAGDFDAARRLYEQLVLAGHPGAHFYLAMMLEHGHGTPAEPERAAALAERSLALGYREAVALNMTNALRGAIVGGLLGGLLDFSSPSPEQNAEAARYMDEMMCRTRGHC